MGPNSGPKISGQASLALWVMECHEGSGLGEVWGVDDGEEVQGAAGGGGCKGRR